VVSPGSTTKEGRLDKPDQRGRRVVSTSSTTEERRGLDGPTSEKGA
jgi:hypothetical protein